MIEFIAIKDFALIKDCTFSLYEGLNIITGETGSGKSIVATAMSLALGSRADSTFIRHGAEKALVELKASLKGREYIFSREVSFGGKNTCKINGETCSLSSFTSLCKKVAHIHGQFDNQALLNPDSHIDLVDRYNMDDIYPALIEYREKYDNYSRAKAQYNELLSAEKSNNRKIDFYTYSLEEIDNANLQISEDINLEEQLKLLQNSEKISEALDRALNLLKWQEYSAETSINQSITLLRGISDYSESISDQCDRIQGLSYEIEDINEILRNNLDNITFSQGELDVTMERISLIDSLKKKYGDTIGEILEYRDKISKELDNIENFNSNKEALELDLSTALEDLKEAANKLTFLRKNSSEDLKNAIESQLKELNFNEGKIDIRIEALDKPSINGQENMEIYMSTNKGEPLKPLVKVASGGEVSRIMLAIKSITASFEQIPTLIFDEIDSGISGITASIVGEKLKALSSNHQIICITHLPQIAAKGDSNYKIYKESQGTETFTFVEELNEKSKIQEIARLLGGTKITENTIKNAKELISL